MDAKTGANIKSGQVRRRRQGELLSDLRGNDRPVGDRHRQVLRRDRDVHLRSRATPRPAAASPRSPISTATKASCSIAAIRSSSWPSTAISSKPATCCSTASCRPPLRNRLRQSRHPPHHGARADEPLLSGLPPRRASDGGHDRLRRRALGLLPRLDRHLRSAPAHGRVDPHDRQDADDGGDGLQIFDRPAVHLSEERARLRDQLSAHVLRGAVRGIQAQCRCWRAPWTASSSCTPTTSRMPRPRRCGSPAPPAPIRSPASRPAAPGCGVRRMAAPTRRRSTCCARSARVGAHPGIHPPRQGQERQLPPDGLRPSGLQELRPAREDHAEDLPRSA